MIMGRLIRGLFTIIIMLIAEGILELLFIVFRFLKR